MSMSGINTETIIDHRPVIAVEFVVLPKCMHTFFRTVSGLDLSDSTVLCTKLHTYQYTSTLIGVAYMSMLFLYFKIKWFIIRLMIIIDQVILLCCSYVMMNWN